MTEHLALEQALRDTAEFDFHKRLFGALAVDMDGFGNGSLPVPLSPVISTEALVRAMRATVFSTSISPLDLPMMWLRFKPSVCSSGTSFGAAVSSKRSRYVAARAALFHGLVMKSKRRPAYPARQAGYFPMPSSK